MINHLIRDVKIKFQSCFLCLNIESSENDLIEQVKKSRRGERKNRVKFPQLSMTTISGDTANTRQSIVQTKPMKFYHHPTPWLLQFQLSSHRLQATWHARETWNFSWMLNRMITWDMWECLICGSRDVQWAPTKKKCNYHLKLNFYDLFGSAQIDSEETSLSRHSLDYGKNHLQDKRAQVKSRGKKNFISDLQRKTNHSRRLSTVCWDFIEWFHWLPQY